MAPLASGWHGAETWLVSSEYVLREPSPPPGVVIAPSHACRHTCAHASAHLTVKELPTLSRCPENAEHAWVQQGLSWAEWLWWPVCLLIPPPPPAPDISPCGWAGGIPQQQFPLDGLGWDAKPVEAEGPGGGPSLLSSADRIWRKTLYLALNVFNS